MWWNGIEIPIRRLGDASLNAPRLPETFLSIAQQLEGTNGTLSRWELPDRAAHALVDAVRKRARDLGLGDIDGLGARPLLVLLANLICASFAYDEGIHATSWFGRVGSQLRRMRHALLGDPLRIARGAVSNRRSLVACHQFAIAMNVLFRAVKRSTGMYVASYVPIVLGRTESIGWHAWNLLVDEQSIVAFDLTTLSTKGSSMVDLDAYFHVSSVLGTAWSCHNVGDVVSAADIRALFASVVDPHSVRGQYLLLNLADHFVATKETRAAIIAHLERVDFARTLPNWRAYLPSRTAVDTLMSSRGTVLPLDLGPAH